MPIRRNIPKLAELCIQSIAENLIYHSQAFKICDNNQELLCCYYTFQYLFAEMFLDKLFRIHQTCKKIDDSGKVCFCRCLFFESKNPYANEWRKTNATMCLEFIFPENIRKISMKCNNYIKSQISEEVTSHIFTKCKAMNSLDLHRSCLNQFHFLKAVSRWNNIAKLNLSQTQCTDLMVIVIWEKLPHLRELYLSFCSNITDMCLFHLCGRLSGNTPHLLCKKNGFCTDAKRKLKVLDIDGTKISEFGVLSALLHLQSLEDFFESDRKFYVRSYIPPSILFMINACDKENWKLPRLRLKYIDCRDVRRPSNLEKNLSLCPLLEKITILALPDNLHILTTKFVVSIKSVFLIFPNSEVLDSVRFQDFLKQWGQHLEKLVITINRGGLCMRHLMEMLTKCKNLIEFRIVGNLEVVNTNDDLVLEMYPPIENLRVLHLNGVRKINSSQTALFIRILNRMINLRILEVSSFVAENVLPQTLEMDNFKCLEKIVINSADMSNISFERFLNAQNNLKEITLSGCKNKGIFLEKCTELSRKNNFSLDINHHKALFYGLARPDELAEKARCCRPWN